MYFIWQHFLNRKHQLFVYKKTKFQTKSVYNNIHLCTHKNNLYNICTRTIVQEWLVRSNQPAIYKVQSDQKKYLLGKVYNQS